MNKFKRPIAKTLLTIGLITSSLKAEERLCYVIEEITQKMFKALQNKQDKVQSQNFQKDSVKNKEKSQPSLLEELFKDAQKKIKNNPKDYENISENFSQELDTLKSKLDLVIYNEKKREAWELVLNELSAYGQKLSEYSQKIPQNKDRIQIDAKHSNDFFSNLENRKKELSLLISLLASKIVT